jgi:hypothetical protein
MTFPRGYHNAGFEANFIRPHFSDNKLISIGLENYPLENGEMIQIYNLERTLVDIWNPRNKYDLETKENALSRYISFNDITENIDHIKEYSKLLNIGNVLVNRYFDMKGALAA